MRKTMPLVQRRPAGLWPLDRPLIELSSGDCLSVRDCMTGFQIFGATGSGKTSGSLATLAAAMLRDDWGMLVLTTRVGEAEQWESWAAKNGRASDVLRIEADGRHRFNFLDYLDRHPVPGLAIPTNIGDLVMNLAKHARPSGKPSETSQFFAESASKMVTQAIHLLRASGERLTLKSIARVIDAAPSHHLEAAEPHFQDSLIPTLLDRAYEQGSEHFESLGEYWLRHFPGMNERTRGDIISTLSAVIHRFTEQPIRDLIASDSGNTYIPEMIDRGCVMVLDCPVITYGEAGRLFQIAMKYLTQRMILRRSNRDTTRPVAIFADEAQNFVTPFDPAYQNTCRDPRGCTIYATQSIDNYRDAIGSSEATEALLGSLVTKIFHNNAGSTNKWAEELIANDWRKMSSDSMNQRGEHGKHTFGLSHSDQMHAQVPAVEFTRLRTGGPQNNGIVDSILFQPGRIFSTTQRPFTRVGFAQPGLSQPKGP